jgi:hypothetical protein
LLLTVIFDELLNVERDELVKLAALRFMSAATPSLAPEKVVVLFWEVSLKLTATLSLLKLTLLKEVALLIRTVSLLKVLVLFQVTELLLAMLTVPPLKVQSVQVPPVLIVRVTPGVILKTQLVQVEKPLACHAHICLIISINTLMFLTYIDPVSGILSHWKLFFPKLMAEGS